MGGLLNYIYKCKLIVVFYFISLFIVGFKTSKTQALNLRVKLKLS